MAELRIREADALEDLRRVAGVLAEVWGQEVLTVELLRALATHGNPVLVAELDGRVVGAQMAFLGMDADGTILHSHVTGVAPGVQHEGVGTALKWAQRDWALEHGIDRITWTFDPLLARNAYLNLRKLGARAVRFHRDFYGPMDDAFNAGDRSDRLEIDWRLRDPRVEAAAEGTLEPESQPEGITPILRERDGRPRASRTDADRAAIRVPPDYLGLRERDPGLARAWRDAVADALEWSFGEAFVAVDFLREGIYILERR